MSKLLEITVNCPSEAVASDIATRIVGARLAASSNTYGQIKSLFRWKGKIEGKTEIALKLKTKTECFDRVVEQVRAIHPYETPSIVGHVVDFVDDDYMRWLESETIAG